MHQHEYSKCSKMIHEIILFFLINKVSNYEMEINDTQEKIVMTFKIQNFPQKACKKFFDNMKCGHQDELEEFGWELIGNSHTREELHLVGCLIDDITHEDVDSRTIIKLVRKHR